MKVKPVLKLAGALGLALGLIFAGVVYGILVYRNGIFPFEQLRRLNHRIEVLLFPDRFRVIDEIYLQTDVDALLSVHNESDVEALRKNVIEFIWEEESLPLDKQPSNVTRGFREPFYDSIDSLESIEKIVVSMDFGFESNAYHFLPRERSGAVVVYHQGHGANLPFDTRIIEAFLDRGIAVVGMNMPLYGDNRGPTIEGVNPMPGIRLEDDVLVWASALAARTDRFGIVKIESHEQMKYLYPEQGHPMRFFLEPVIIVLNHLEMNYGYGQVSMVGLSGGGWTTTLVAALDPRIDQSFPVAGSYPIYLRSGSPEDWGDWEQNVPELYRLANYPELYVLGAFGEGRKQIQFINLFDSCCFAGSKWQTYKDVVRGRVADLGMGSWDLVSDESHYYHWISDVVLGQILREIAP